MTNYYKKTRLVFPIMIVYNLYWDLSKNTIYLSKTIDRMIDMAKPKIEDFILRPSLQASPLPRQVHTVWPALPAVL